MAFAALAVMTGTANAASCLQDNRPVTLTGTMTMHKTQYGTDMPASASGRPRIRVLAVKGGIYLRGLTKPLTGARGVDTPLKGIAPTKPTSASPSAAGKYLRVLSLSPNPAPLNIFL